MCDIDAQYLIRENAYHIFTILIALKSLRDMTTCLRVCEKQMRLHVDICSNKQKDYCILSCGDLMNARTRGQKMRYNAFLLLGEQFVTNFRHIYVSFLISQTLFLTELSQRNAADNEVYCGSPSSTEFCTQFVFFLVSSMPCLIKFIFEK